MGCDGMWKPDDGSKATTISLEKARLKSTGPMSSTRLKTPSELLGTFFPCPICTGALCVLLTHGNHAGKHWDLSQKMLRLPSLSTQTLRRGTLPVPNCPEEYGQGTFLDFHSFHEGKYKHKSSCPSHITFCPYSGIGRHDSSGSTRQLRSHTLGMPLGPDLSMRHDRGSSGTHIRGSLNVMTCYQ